MEEDNQEIIKPEFPATRIKKIIHSNDDIGKIGVLVSGVVSIATELFIKNLIEISCEKTTGNRVTIEDIKKAVKGSPMYDFISMMDVDE